MANVDNIINAMMHVDALRERAAAYDVDAVNELATLASGLLVACINAYETSYKSACDAVDIITEELGFHGMLPEEDTFI